MEQEEQFFASGDGPNIFKRILYKYLPFWPLFFITIGTGMVIAFFKLRAADLEYITSSRVMIKDPYTGGDESTKILQDLNIFRSRKSLDNEIVTLKSTELITKAVKDLDMYARVYNKGNVKTEELYGSSSPIKFIAVDKDNFNLWKTLFFDMDWSNGRILIDDQKVPFDDTLWINGQGLLMEINKSYNTGAKGKNFFVTFSGPSAIAGAFSGGMALKPYSYSSSILDITVKTTMPAKAKDLLIKVFDIYNKESAIDKNIAATRTIDFIDERLQLVTKQLDSVEKDISSYKIKTDVVDLGSQASNYFSNVNGLDISVAQFDLRLEALDDVERQFRAQEDVSRIIPSLSLINDPSLSGLFKSWYDGEQELSKLESITGPKNEATILAQNNVQRLKEDIDENMKGLRKNILLNKRKVQERISMNNSMLNTIPEKERMFLDISRQQAVKNNIYTFLLQKKEETAIASVATSPDLKIIEPPSSRGPVAPLPRKFYMTALIAGLITAAGLVLFKELLNRRVLFRSEVEKTIKAPIVGELMQHRAKGDFLVIGSNTRSVIAEQFRMIRTNLSFFGLNDKNKVLVVTSSISSEGKSFVAANLALSLTLMGNKVLLMELDLRRPSLSKKMGFSSKKGISSYLSGAIGLDEIIQQTPYENLSFASAGISPPNPAELISGDRFGEMIDRLKKEFDFVIMDTAPVAPVSDTFLIGKHCDITLFVVRHKVTPRTLLEGIQKIYENKRFKNMAVVFNGIKPRGMKIFGINMAGYGNEYGAAYGYGNDYAGKYAEGYYVDAHRGFSVRRMIKKMFKKGE